MAENIEKFISSFQASTGYSFRTSINICALRNIRKRRNDRNISVNFTGKYSRFAWQLGRSPRINKNKSEITAAASRSI